MKAMYFTHYGRLTGRNAEINANRTHWAVGAKVKEKAQEDVCWSIRLAQSKGTIQPIEEPVEILIDWFDAPNRGKTRDVDNIQSSTKYILDALKQMGIIPDDSQKWVKQVYQRVIPSKTDYVVVELSCDGYSVAPKRVNDIAQVVRCRDCKRWCTFECPMRYITDFGATVDGSSNDGYCFWGERRNDGEVSER